MRAPRSNSPAPAAQRRRPAERRLAPAAAAPLNCYEDEAAIERPASWMWSTEAQPPADKAQLTQQSRITVCFALHERDPVVLELDLGCCTPRDVIRHLIGESALARSAGGQPLRYALARSGSFLLLDASLASSGVEPDARVELQAGETFICG